MARFSLTDTLICGCEGLYTCQLHLWMSGLCACVYGYECMFVPYRGPCRQHAAVENRACSCKQHLGSSPSLGWWCHSWAPLLVSLDCFHCLGSHSSGSGLCRWGRRGENKREKSQKEIKEQRKRQEVSCYCLDMGPAWGFALIRVSLEHGRSFEKPFPLSLASRNLISHLRRDTNFQLCRGIST